MIRAMSALAIGISVTATQVIAEDSIFWKSVGNWDVSIDTSVGYGCFASATWESGTFLRLGFNPEADNFYMLVGNGKWTSLRAGEEYDIQIKFDSKAPWDVSATGFQFNPGELVYLHASSSKFDFIEEFMRHNKMKISYQGKEIDTLRLTGSSRAFKEVIKCQEDADTRGGTVADPFAGSSSSATGSGRKPADPFAD